jgi:beta-phosphoglucomutase
MCRTIAVIFDMDGVLVDSYDAHRVSWQRLAEQRGYEMTREQFAATFGRTSREIIEELWSHADLSAEQVAELDDRKEALYREVIAADFPAMDGVIGLIDDLDAAGVRLAVGSSGPPENVAAVMEQLRRGDAFSATVTGNDVTRGKPDPQVFQIAAQRLNVPPADCVVVEDAPAGIAAARAAGMKSVGVVSTGRTAFALADADLVVDSLHDLSSQTIRSLLRS